MCSKVKTVNGTTLQVLKKPEYFGKFGRIYRVVINNSTVYTCSQVGYMRINSVVQYRICCISPIMIIAYFFIAIRYYITIYGLHESMVIITTYQMRFLVFENIRKYQCV